MLDCTQVQKQLQRLLHVGFIVLFCPPFTGSRDLALLDFHLFLKLKEHLRGCHSVLDDEVKTAVKLWFCHHDAQFYCEGLQNYLKVDECLSTAKVIMWRNNCIEVNNEV